MCIDGYVQLRVRLTIYLASVSELVVFAMIRIFGIKFP